MNYRTETHKQGWQSTFLNEAYRALAAQRNVMYLYKRIKRIVSLEIYH